MPVLKVYEDGSDIVVELPDGRAAELRRCADGEPVCYHTPEWLSGWKHLASRFMVEWEVPCATAIAAAPLFASILHEAIELTGVDRQQDYGDPRENMLRWRDMVRAMLGTQITAEDLVRIMLCLKLSRDMHRPKRDNPVDIAGYAWLLDCVRGL